MRLMTLEELVIAAVRVAGSLPVLRWAFAGAIVAILVDLSDLFLRAYLDLGGVDNYQAFDKWLDQVYQFAFLVVAWRWGGVPRKVALALYLYRLIGFVAFEAGAPRETLIFFPNVFEFWFVFVAAQRHWWKGFRYTRPATAASLALLTALKLFHEYALHVGQWFDSFTAADVVDAVVQFIRQPF
jgi:hypothetical protein